MGLGFPTSKKVTPVSALKRSGLVRGVFYVATRIRTSQLLPSTGGQANLQTGASGAFRYRE